MATVVWGVLIVPLFLFEKGLLSSPNFYINEYLEHNRDGYYEHLLAMSWYGEWTGWVAFFLRALIAQGETNQDRALKILALYD